MTKPALDISRRTALAAGGLAAVALAAGKANAVPTGAEKANTALVENFLKAWSGENVEIDQMVATYMADDCIVRFMDSTMMATGKTATTAMFKGFCTGGLTYDLKVLDGVAIGPIVANTRIDSTFIPGKPATHDKIAGVFVIHDGKIKEWSDYFMR